ncbi:MAG: P-type conjugative transfer protein TrbG [Pseudomonadota bacterium]
MTSRLILALLGASCLCACKSLTFQEKGPDIILDEEEFVEAIYLDETEPLDVGAERVVYRTMAPTTMPGQLKPIPASVSATSDLRPDQAIDAANAQAAIEPHPDNYMNAIQIYPYAIGALYQVYTAPEQVTDIALQPGEELMSVSAGDTVRWVLGDAVSGVGENAQVHILVKPIKSGLKTNLIITTSRRAYHLELTAFNETYMAAVSWRYPDDPLVRRTASTVRENGAGSETALRGLQLERLQFRYDISGDKPHWRPERVFDDGRKVYIQFPGRLDQGEAPPLFVVGRDGKSQLVNYRMRDHYYIVDRLFARAELRMGERDQDVVRIKRLDLDRSSQ